MKAREVREMCKGRVDPQVLHCIEAIAETQSVMRQEMMEMAVSIDQAITILGDVIKVAGNMQKVTDKLQGLRGEDSHEHLTEN